MRLPDTESRVRIQSVEVLSDDWYVLKKTTFDFRHADATCQRQGRETYDRGHGATILDEAGPEERIKAETEEETGYRVGQVRKVFELFMSPGSVTEKLYFFVGAYDPSSKVHAGGGIAAEGEDIEVLELGFEEALRMTETGEIADGKTLLLLQYARLHLFPEPSDRRSASPWPPR